MKTLLFFSIFLFSMTSFASVDEFKGSASIIVEKLQSQGIHKVGDLDLDELANEIRKTKWRELTNGFFLGSGKERTTAVYLVKEKVIVVSELAVRLIDPAIYPQASLHEVLGMRGYNDENYEMTLSLDQLSKNPYQENKVFEQPFKNVGPRSRENQLYKSQDGGTSVGGGGDGIALEVKQRVLNEAVESSKADKTIQNILYAEFEPNWNPKATKLVFSKNDGKMSIEIPCVQWLFLNVSKDEAQKKAVAQKILEAFTEDK